MKVSDQVRETPRWTVCLFIDAVSDQVAHGKGEWASWVWILERYTDVGPTSVQARSFFQGEPRTNRFSCAQLPTVDYR